MKSTITILTMSRENLRELRGSFEAVEFEKAKEANGALSIVRPWGAAVKGERK